jgi:DNA-binding CsgD family transcriptional regulator
MSAAQKLYPGLTCDNVELFNDGHGLKAIYGGAVKAFHELPFLYIQAIKEAIQNNPAVKFQLERMHPDSEMKQIEQFAICNFSGLDHTADIAGGVLQEGEYWDCPKRGLCPAEGILCKQLQYNGKSISSVEIKMIKLLSTDMTNEAMADELFLRLGTYHLIKKKLYEKLGVSTKQEITLIGVALNIIQITL